MFGFLRKEWDRFRRCDEGVTLVEYGIALVVAVTVGTPALLGLANKVVGAMTSATNAIP